jgi:hypothetical protein
VGGGWESGTDAPSLDLKTRDALIGGGGGGNGGQQGESSEIEFA